MWLLHSMNNKKMYFMAGLLSVRTEVKRLCDDCNSQKDHLLTLTSHLGCDKVCCNLHTGGAMYNFSGRGSIRVFCFS
jgi:hypothetical protein